MEQIRTKVSSQTRWLRAAERAEKEAIRVCQLQGTGQWIATSGSNSSAAYEIAVTGNVAHDCDCLAGLNGDPVCKHRAAFYLLIGALVTPEPEPPAPASATVCLDCHGGGVHYDRNLEKAGLLYPTCRACQGSGMTTLTIQQAA